MSAHALNHQGFFCQGTFKHSGFSVWSRIAWGGPKVSVLGFRAQGLKDVP